MHPVIAIDSETEAVLGLLDARLWTRTDEFVMTPMRTRALKDKESMRWLDGAAQAGRQLAQAASVVVVADREGDIYASFARRLASVDLIVAAGRVCLPPPRDGRSCMHRGSCCAVAHRRSRPGRDGGPACRAGGGLPSAS